MAEAWTEVSVQTTNEAAEAVAEMLRPFAHSQAIAIEEVRGNDLGRELWQPETEPSGPDATTVRVKIYFPTSQDSPEQRQHIDHALSRVQDLGPVEPPNYSLLQEEDWANAWKAHYHPIRVGQLLRIQPSWEEGEPAGQDEIVIRLDPGMAFGTGTHATTQLCLMLLEELVQPGMRVLDVGTGSGILAIAAARLGAAYVLATDLDPLAVQTATENAVANNVASRVRINQGSLPSKRSWHLVIVNILAPVIERLLLEHDLLSYAAGPLILSGFVEEQEAEVRSAITTAGGVVTAARRLDDWLAVVAESRNLTQGR